MSRKTLLNNRTAILQEQAFYSWGACAAYLFTSNHASIKMPNIQNGDLGQIVLNALIKITEKSKHVKIINFSELLHLLDLNKLVLIVVIKKLQKQGYLDVIFDDDVLYFKLTNLYFEVV